MVHNFFAAISRMKYIERWALMRNSREENLSEHSLEVAMIAHVLAVIGNKRYGHNMNTGMAALAGIYHDASEIITGDMPTPVKYYNSEIRAAYKDVEHIADDKLLSKLPEDLRDEFTLVFKGNREDPEDQYLRRLVKAADKISALIKCMEESQAGNTEFRTAEESVRRKVYDLEKELPEVRDFISEFLPAYGKTLDELNDD